VTDYVFAGAHRYPDRAALIELETSRMLTYRQLLEAIDRARVTLTAAGLRPRGIVGLLAANGVDYPVAFHAAASLGAITTTLNPHCTAAELNHQLHDCGATILLTGPEHAERARGAALDSAVTTVIGLDELSAGRPPDGRWGATAVDPATIAALPYSSGTTGLPKGVMLSHLNLVAQLQGCAAADPHEDGEIALAVLPFFHIFGLQVILNNVLAQGGTLVTMRRFESAATLAAIEQHRVSRFYAVPPILAALAEHPMEDRRDLSSLRSILCGAAPLAPALARTAGERLGSPVRQGFGMTEVSGASHLTPPDGRPDTCGQALPGIECRIVDHHGIMVPVATDGEVWIRGPQVMVGYHGRPDATAQILDADGWLHTGDIGRLDLDGNLTVVDRVKELIKSNGFQVAPAELETILTTHHAVRDGAVIGVPDPAAGEVPKAFVVLNEGATATAEDIQEFVNSQVARYKRVRHVEFVEAVPRNASGKLLRRQLRAYEAIPPTDGQERWRLARLGAEHERNPVPTTIAAAPGRGRIQT
jgi:4-coumarate--CoA ligase